MKTFVLLAVLLLQAAPEPLAGVRTTIRQLRDQSDSHKTTMGAAAELTTAKHQLRDWIDAQLAGQSADIDILAVRQAMHNALRDAGLFCNDCDEDVLGYLDPVRVERQGEFLIVVAPMGITCNYDDSAYVYARQGQQWKRIWDFEQTTYTQQEYLPQAIHDIQISAPDANGRRTLMVLGSQPICRGSFLNIYTRAWRIGQDFKIEQTLDRRDRAYDGYPPILGRVQPDDVLIEFMADGFLSGDMHVAVRHIVMDGATPRQVDPIAALPRDFVLEWLDAPWTDSRRYAENPALEAQHAQLRRTDSVGDTAEDPRRCTAEPNVWQVGTRLFEGPKRYYRVRWRDVGSFSLIGISETPYPDCTVPDDRGDTYPNLRGNRAR